MIKSRFYIDIPDIHKGGGGWQTVADFADRKEALEYAKRMFGADDEGRVQLISEVQEEESEEDINIFSEG